MSTVSRKIGLVGDFGVGKTSLIRQFVERQFDDRYLSSVGVKISRKSVESSTQSGQPRQNLQLVIWDIEGQTRFKAIAPSYLQGAKGAILVGDVTRQDSLTHLAQHLELFLSVNPQGTAIVALNKSDLLDAAELAQCVARYQWHDQPKILGTFGTSAKTGLNVDAIFNTLAQTLVE